MKHILFVCTGNTCRSPMAEVLLQKTIEERHLEGEFSVSSAGIYAYAGDPASSGAREAIREYGLDLGAHRATVLSEVELEESWLVLTMTTHHKESIRDIWPEYADRIFTLKEFAGSDSHSMDVLDPFGGDTSDYIQCAADIREALENAEDKLFDKDDPFI